MNRRRVFLATTLAFAGFGRRMRGQLSTPTAPVRYAPLTHVVKIPLEAVSEAWRPVAFVAEGMAARRRVLISGVLFRNPTNLTALCITCPHEQCQVDFVVDEMRLIRILGQTPTRPLFECGCHASVFDAAAEGSRLSGESPRGLYRFRVAGVRDGMVEINEIEEIALSEV